MSTPARTFQGSLLLALAVTHVACWLATLTSGLVWVGSFKMALDWAAGSVFIAGPVTAALAAWTYAGLSQSSLPVLLAGAPRATGAWWRPGLVVLLGASLGLVALVLELCAMAVALDLPISARQLTIVPYCVLMLAVHVLIGACLGRSLPPRWAAPIAGLLTFMVFMAATAGYAPRAFVTGSVSGSLVGQQYRLEAIALLSISAMLLVAGLLTVSLPSQIGPPGRVGTGALVVAALAAFAIGRCADLDVEGRLEFVPVSFTCAGTHPEVCVAAETPRALDATARRLHQLARPLYAVGADVPRRWKESVPGGTGDPGSGGISYSDDDDLTGEVADDDMIFALTIPADCPSYTDGTDPEESLLARDRLGRWIAFRNGLGDTHKASPWFSSAASEEWVRTTYARLVACDLDAVRLP